MQTNNILETTWRHAAADRFVRGIWAFFIAEKSGAVLSMAVIIPYLEEFPFLLFALGCLGFFGIGVALVFSGNPDPH